MKNKKKIYFLTGKAGGFKAMEPLLKEIIYQNDFDLKIIVTDQHLDKNFGSTSKNIDKNFNNQHLIKIKNINKNGTAYERTNSMSFLLNRLSKFFKSSKPDLMMIYGDRMESLITSLVCLNFSVPILHFQGGDLSGNIDEKIRHSITKLSDHHFVSNKSSLQRLIQMGESPSTVYNVGDSHIDSLKKVKIEKREVYFKKYKIEKNLKPIIFMLHPENVTDKVNFQYAINSLKSLKKLPHKKICIYPCNDLGFQQIIKALKIFKNRSFSIYKNIPYEDFIGLLKNCQFLIGNSSSGIIESSYLNIPVVNLGRRQNLRLKSSNVINSNFNLNNIKKSIKKALDKKFISKQVTNCKKLYGDGHAFKRVYNVLKKSKLKKISLEKKFKEIKK